MSLESCRIVLSDGASIIFGIEDKIFNKNRAQAVQLSGLGSPKLNINSSDLVGGGRFVYGSFTDQREISFALTFPSVSVYKKYRDFLENEAMQDSLECSQGNDDKLSLVFKNSSGATYTTKGFFREVKTDLFTDDPILWANFICFDDDFYYENYSEDRNPEATFYLPHERITPMSRPNGTYNGADLFQKFYKFDYDWNPYGNTEVKAGEIRILFPNGEFKRFRNIKKIVLDCYYDPVNDENKEFSFELDNMFDYIHPDTTHLDLRFFTKNRPYKQMLVKCWGGPNAFVSEIKATWVPFSNKKTNVPPDDVDDWCLRPNSKGPSGILYGAPFISSLPDNIRVWYYFNNPYYYNKTGHVRSIHDV